ncbi:serine protease easter-like isoform X2 [Sitodiplosis mosellana]|nr:serine protease easter-like isoform X2 [Sitodiplosis mosellana]
MLLNMVLTFNTLSIFDKEFVRSSQCENNGPVTKVCCNTSVFKESDFPQPGVCGTQFKERIVGGEETTITDFPWMALIQYEKTGERPRYLCGGSLINKDYILTAAHCIASNKLMLSGWGPTTVRLGEHNLLTDLDCEDDSEIDCADPVIDVAINQTIYHERYQSNLPGQHHDIALIRLAQSITFTDWVKPVCLPFALHLRNRTYTNVHLSVAGFGRTENGTLSDVKMKVEINGFNWNRCNDKYGRRLIAAQLCAGGEEGKDSCSGDSGGPLHADDKTSRGIPYTYLAGIVSRGPQRCGTPGYPAIYTKVDQYLDWIMQNMKP